jgi:hydroxymethylpyrimidine pyrophosphatase-like HAD family hydrolase
MQDGGVMGSDHGVDTGSRYFKAIAIDYDGTLTEGGVPAPSVLAAVRSARATGLRLLLVTGRTLTDLWQVFPDVGEYFDLTVAENGGVLRTAEGHRRLASPVDPELATALHGRGIPVQSGEVIIGCDAVHDAEVFEEIRRLDLDCQLIRNRGALMVVPAGVTKASGLGAGLRELGLSAHSAIAIGDAENDLALLEACELGVAVANAVPVVKQHADLVLDHADGPGITAFLEGPIVRGEQPIHPERWRIRLGTLDDGGPATLPSSQINLLVTGASQSGKSYLAGLITEQLIRLRYSVLVIDPEGDHARLGELPDVLVVGGREGLPTPERLANLLGLRLGSVVADLSFLSREDANRYVREVAPLVERQRVQKGSPHWVVIDEAHGALGEGGAATQYLAPGASGYLLVSYQPWELSGEALGGLDAMIVVAGGQQSGIGNVAKAMAGFAGGDAARLMSRLEVAGLGRALLATRGGGHGRCRWAGELRATCVTGTSTHRSSNRRNRGSTSGAVQAGGSSPWRETFRSFTASSVTVRPRWCSTTPCAMTSRAGSRVFFVTQSWPKQSRRSSARRRQLALTATRSATSCSPPLRRGTSSK